jgi:hypothetical protein
LAGLSQGHAPRHAGVGGTPRTDVTVCALK